MFDEPLTCFNCGHEFDPIRTRWLCPVCGYHTPCCDGAPLPVANPYDETYAFTDLVVCYDTDMSTARAVENGDDDLLSSSEVSRLKGMTRSRLDRWVTQGFLRPVVVGGTRMFTKQDRHVVQVMVALVDAGIGVEAAHRAAMNQGWLSDNIQVIIGSKSQHRQWRSLQTVFS
jgi:hypothetical protein